MLCCSDGIPEKEIAYLNLATQNKVDGIVALTYSDIGNFINLIFRLLSSTASLKTATFLELGQIIIMAA